MTTNTTTEPDVSEPRGLPAETAPSEIRRDEPTVARWVGMIGLFLVLVASLALYFNTFSDSNRLIGQIIGPLTASFLAVLGVAAMLLHAAKEAESQIRRLYGILGFGLVLLALVLFFVPAERKSLLMLLGTVGLLLGLFFLLAFARNEDDPAWLRSTFMTIGGVGVGLAATALIGGNVSRTFLLNPGAELGILGLVYLWAAVGLIGPATDQGYRLARLIGAAGALAILAAVVRVVIGQFQTPPQRLMVPDGLLLMGLGTLYITLAIGLTADWPVVVVARRELTAYFYSPVAYVVLFGFTCVGWLSYFLFVAELLTAAISSVSIDEPIVRSYLVNLIPVFAVMFVVPAVTMRLLSEENRTGTLEMLLTAPVGEVTVVFGKFLAALLFYLFLWIPWALFLVALYGESRDGFDVRPLLSYGAVLIATGSGFLSMGLFFSSLTRNQIAAAILTFMGMMFMLGLYLVPWQVRQLGETWRAVFKQLSFVDLWFQAVGGKVYLRDLVVHGSITVFWLFLTVKVLEARKWR